MLSIGWHGRICDSGNYGDAVKYYSLLAKDYAGNRLAEQARRILEKYPKPSYILTLDGLGTTKIDRGWLVTRVFRGSYSDRSGIWIGDIIVSVEGYEAKSIEDLSDYFSVGFSEGGMVEVTVLAWTK